MWLRTPPTLRDLVCDRLAYRNRRAATLSNNSVMAYVTLFDGPQP
jgi:membrane-bound lytic murein transglycosylase D